MNRLVLCISTLVLAGGLVFARNQIYNRRQAPRLPLQDACPLALQALGPATNQFYCLGAQMVAMRSASGEWLFDFATTNGAEKHVFVFFNKTTQVVNGPLAVF